MDIGEVPAALASTPAAVSEFRTCKRCVMDTTDPEITFDANGVCNHCIEYDRVVRQFVFSGEEGTRLLEENVRRIQQDGAGKAYDCVIGVSGGVDSTYVAYKVKQLGLRPVAIHLDNGWDSEIAVSNISVALAHLGIDLHTHVIDWEEFKDIQLAFLRSGVPDCEIPSDHAIVACMHRIAWRLGVRHAIWGYNLRTETHLPSAWSQGHYDWGYIRAIHRRFGSGKVRTFPHLSFLSFVTGDSFRLRRLHLLDYIDYSKQEALQVLQRELGWRSYGGKHHESIYTRWYQGWFLPLRFGYDKRKAHFSSLICSGQMSRAAALEELQRPSYSHELQQSDTQYVIKKLGISRRDLDDILAAPKRRFDEFPSYRKLSEGTPFRTALGIYRRLKPIFRRLRQAGE